MERNRERVERGRRETERGGEMWRETRVEREREREEW